jgi:hypothetical protein
LTCEKIADRNDPLQLKRDDPHVNPSAARVGVILPQATVAGGIPTSLDMPFLSQQVARFLGHLAEYQDRDGSVHENTIVLVGSGAGTTHNPRNLPTLIAGGSRMGLKHGTYWRNGHPGHQSPSGEQPPDNPRWLAVDQRAFAVWATEHECGGIKPEQVQEGGVEVGVGHHVLDGLVPKFIGRAVDIAFLESASSEPGAEAVGVVIATDILLVLDHRQTAHLTSPVDHG